MLQSISPKAHPTFAEVPVSPARKKLPAHLQKYVVEQHYERYTPEDQAVWRFVMRQLKNFLSVHAHECYADGLVRTGIQVDQIPRIDEMDKKLSEFGWGAVPVSGFIPPAAFMEFQSLGILPIASDMRSIDHLTYTPAPDIVHEAAGHAPILINPEFAAYLKQYAEVARHAIITREDMDQYEAIRRLSDVKENPVSSTQQIADAEAELARVNKTFTQVSEAGWLSRMNWWTAEYGLIGSIDKPLIYGAGLLSSVGESREYLSAKVRKIPLSIECIDTGYDITEPQPQLFVTPNFKSLTGVLEQLANRMAYRLGGVVGLKRSQQARTVNTVVLDSGLQISGQLESFKSLKEEVNFIRFIGPVALSTQNQQLEGHGRDLHPQGFSSPLGRLQGFNKPLSQAADNDLKNLNIQRGQKTTLHFASGIFVEGVVVDWTRQDQQLILIQFDQVRVQMNNEVLFDPSWGRFDMAVGEKVVSVFGGPADRLRFGETEDFVSARVPQRSLSDATKNRYAFYNEIRQFREAQTGSDLVWLALYQRYLSEFKDLWLPAVELIEISHKKNIIQFPKEMKRLEVHLQTLKPSATHVAECIQDGLRLADQNL